MGNRPAYPRVTKVDAFWARAYPIRPRHLERLHELTLGMYWAHRSRDLELLFSLGRGHIALDEIGRPLGSIMVFPSGSQFASLGMMTIAPRLNTPETAAWLLNLVLEACDDHDLRLCTAQEAQPVFEKAGFVPTRKVVQMQGRLMRIFDVEEPPDMVIRPMRASDMGAILALDLQVFGVERDRVIETLVERSKCLVAEEHGELRGFACLRPFGRGQIIGPLVAQADSMAIAFCTRLLPAAYGDVLRIDAPIEPGPFASFLKQLGLRECASTTEMYRGALRRPGVKGLVTALASQSLG